MSIKNTTTGKRVVVGYDQYVNQRTGEVEEFAVIQSKDADWNFEKIWLYKLVEVLNLAGGAKIKVLFWMLDNRDPENRVIATQAKIAEGSKVSTRTVSSLLTEMRDEGLISVVQSGVYRLDPSLVWKGSHKGRMSVLMQFRKEAADSVENTREAAAAE